MRIQTASTVTRAIAPHAQETATAHCVPVPNRIASTTIPTTEAEIVRSAARPRRLCFTFIDGSIAPDLTRGRGRAFVTMMEAVTVPPFERFYEEQREPVLVQLRRMLGRDAADDAFQETFLRALRAYPSLKHGQHLRAWAVAIARNVAIDAYRRGPGTPARVPDPRAGDEPPPHQEAPRPTADPPPKERAAGLLRHR